MRERGVRALAAATNLRSCLVIGRKLSRYTVISLGIKSSKKARRRAAWTFSTWRNNLIDCD
jgi:hypothetical protein